MSKKQEIFWLPKDISCWCHQMSRFCAENLVRIHTFEVFFFSFQVFCEFECLFYENTFVLTFIMGIFCLRHSHRKRRDSLESSLDRVLFAAKPEFLKILVPRLPQNSSNAKIKFAEKPKQLLFTWPASWSTDISSFCYSDIDLFFIDYACCKLCNTWLLLFENNSRSYHSTWASHWRKNIVAVITQDRVIDDNLKRQIKDRTLHTCWLFLLAQIFQYISNWSKVFGNLPTLFLQYS